ncbi:type II toxin-antitoxin system RelE/ParE family toxin [Oceanospirillum sp. HFRX-1_2]
MELRLAQSAVADLQDILSHYREQGVPHIGEQPVSVMLVSAILEHCEMLLQHPESGRIVPEFNQPHVREVIHPPFRLVYLREADQIALIRVWRSERQLELSADDI